MADFKIGDVVQLRSGGPLMTVSEMGSDKGEGTMFKCMWFESTGSPLSQYFHGQTLKNRNDTQR